MRTRREEEMEAEARGGGGRRGRGEIRRRAMEREGSIIRYDCF